MVVLGNPGERFSVSTFEKKATQHSDASNDIQPRVERQVLAKYRAAPPFPAEVIMYKLPDFRRT